MKSIDHKTPLLVAMFMLLFSAGVGAEEVAQSGSDNGQSVVGKVEHALSRAAYATENGIKRGAEATAHGVKRGAEATAHGIERAAEATARAAHKVASKLADSSSSSSDN